MGHQFPRGMWSLEVNIRRMLTVVEGHSSANERQGLGASEIQLGAQSIKKEPGRAENVRKPSYCGN